MWRYLLLLLAWPLASTAKPLSPANAYILHCAGCHGMDGAGSTAGGIPDFRNYVAAFSRVPAGRRYVVLVPGVGATGLSAAEVAAVMNYVMTRWGGSSLPRDFVPFTPAEVARLRRVEIPDVVKFRRELAVQMQAQNLPVAAYPWP